MLTLNSGGLGWGLRFDLSKMSGRFKEQTFRLIVSEPDESEWTIWNLVFDIK